VGTAKFLDAFGENDSPWDRWSPPWHDDDSYLDYLKERGLQRFTFEREIVGRDATGAPGGNHYGGWIAPQGGRPFPREGTYPFYLVDRAKRALSARPDADRGADAGPGPGGGDASGPGRRDAGGSEPLPEPSTPLYLQLDFFAPHQPFAVPGDMKEREAEIRRELELPDSYAALLERDFQADEREPRIYGMYRRNWGLQDPDTVRDYMVANILQWELLDAAVGEFLDYLRQEGLYESSWVIFMADHGEMNAESALIDKGAYLNPRVLRVPLYAKPPAGETRLLPGVVEEPVSLLDLAPTVTEIAGVRPTERIDGVSLLNRVPPAERLQTAPILFEVWSHVMPNPCVGCVFTAGAAAAAAPGSESGAAGFEADSAGSGSGADRSGAGAPLELYSITYNATCATDELYRIDDEPGLENLYHDPAHAGVVEQGLRTLRRHLRSDRRFNAYADFLELEYPHLAEGGGDRQKFM
jgi:hypothetical protein